MKRFCIFLFIVCLLALPASAEPIRWVDFRVPYESLKYAMDLDIRTSEQENHLNWIDVLALAACRTGGKCGLDSVKKAVTEWQEKGASRETPGSDSKYFQYYRQAYTAVLGGLLGNFAIYKDGQWAAQYGLKAFCPIAQGYYYSHYDDFGASRSFGFRRKHLGNDLLGSPGTPIVAVEGGTVEAMGWNRYGGWRVGIRSHDRKRYYYYAHLQKDTPFPPGLAVGQTVNPGDVIGFMGRTGYSDRENTNNIDITHLHFGMQLIFDESQKDGNNEIWIDVYQLVRLLSQHRSSVCRGEGTVQRVYPFCDLDITPLPER